MKSFRTRTLGFTMIEIMIVMTIIGMIVAMGGAAYSNAVRQGRDARRKVDLDQMRSALELYRSNDPNGTYPLDSFAPYANDPIYRQNNPPYLEQAKISSYLQVPVDPGTKKPYFFRSFVSGTTPCWDPTTYCRDYTIATRLETSTVTASCGGIADNRCYLPDGITKANCNYCVGPLGQK